MKILFLHGLASSGAYKMASTLRILLKGSEVLAPDIDIDPFKAFDELQGLCFAEEPDLIVGLSLGAFWAQKLRGWRKALVNPDFHPSRLLRERLGENKYLSPRKDGAESFLVTEAIAKGYESIEESEFEALTPEERALTQGFFALGDEVVRCGPEFGLHYPGRARYYPGGHLPTFPEIKKWIVPNLELPPGLSAACGKF